MGSIVEKIGKIASKGRWHASSVNASKDAQNLVTLHSRPVENQFIPFESVKSYKGAALIEPETGYVITEAGLLIEDSMMTNNGYFYAPDIEFVPWRHALPSYGDYQKALKSPDTIQVDRVISLRHFWEWNFYHFYADVLAKLSVLDSVVPTDTPIALGPYYYDVKFVRDIIARGDLAKRTWILPKKGQFIKANEVIYAQNRQNFIERFSHLVPLTGAPEPDINSDRRIFLSRPPGGSRSLVNAVEVEKVLAKHGYEAVDSGKLDIADQQTLFAQARHLIAVHGAGMTNMIYRRTAPMSVIELHADNYVTLDMMNIALQHGHDFARLSGKAEPGSPQEASFSLDIDELETLVTKTLSKSEKAVAAK